MDISVYIDTLCGLIPLRRSRYRSYAYRGTGSYIGLSESRRPYLVPVLTAVMQHVNVRKHATRKCMKRKFPTHCRRVINIEETVSVMM